MTIAVLALIGLVVFVGVVLWYGTGLTTSKDRDHTSTGGSGDVT